MFDMPHQQHEMVLIQNHASGAEEWFCPVCGRRVLMQWPPNYERIVLDVGDERAVHASSKGGPRRNNEQPAQNDWPPEDDYYLLPWIEWMEAVDFESWWTRDLKTHWDVN